MSTKPPWKLPCGCPERDADHLTPIDGARPGDEIYSLISSVGKNRAAFSLWLLRQGEQYLLESDGADGHWRVPPEPTTPAPMEVLEAHGFRPVGVVPAGPFRLVLTLQEDVVPVPPGPQAAAGRDQMEQGVVKASREAVAHAQRVIQGLLDRGDKTNPAPGASVPGDSTSEPGPGAGNFGDPT